jgi:heme exporter protein CcmD
MSHTFFIAAAYTATCLLLLGLIGTYAWQAWRTRKEKQS